MGAKFGSALNVVLHQDNETHKKQMFKRIPLEYIVAHNLLVSLHAAWGPYTKPLTA